MEHCLRSGDLNLESWGPSSSSSLGDAIRAHQKVQSSRGEGYRKEVTLSHVVENDLFALEIGGRIDGVLTRDTGVIIEEIKTTTGDLDARAARPGSFGFAPTHWGQLQVYAYIYALQNDLEEVEGRLTSSSPTRISDSIFREGLASSDADEGRTSSRTSNELSSPRTTTTQPA